METGMKKLAIIGAGYIGKIIAEEARKMRVETHCFAWEKGAVAKDSADHFYPVSVTEKEKILDICREIGIDGVVAAASVSITTAAYVAEQMGLNGNPPAVAAEIADKYRNRRLTQDIPELEPVGFRLVHSKEDVLGMNYPLILKPVIAGGKAGLSVVESGEQLEEPAAGGRTPWQAGPTPAITIPSRSRPRSAGDRRTAWSWRTTSRRT